MKKLLFIILTLTLLFCFTANAFEATYNAETNSIIVKGEAKGIITLMILKSGQELNTVSNTNPPIYFGNFTAPVIGSFDETVPLDSDIASGYYDVYVGSAKIEPAVFVVNVEAAKNFIKDNINNAQTSADIKTALLSDAAKTTLGLDITAVAVYAEPLSKLLFKDIPYVDGNSQPDYYKFEAAYNTYEIYAKINSGNSENAQKIITEYETELGIKLSETFNLLNENGKSLMLNEIIKADYTTKVFTSSFREAFLLAAFKSVEYYAELEEVINNYYTEYGINLTEINQCADTGAVYLELMQQKDNVTVITQIAPLVSQVAQAVKQGEGPTTPGIELGGSLSSLGSGGGGGGGGSSSVSSGNKVNMTVEALPTDDVSDSNIENNAGFSDIGKYTWAEEAIEKLKKLNIINGVNSNEFAPARDVTRAEFSKMAATLMKIDGGDSQFGDVSTNDWFYPYVSACVKHGLVYGSGNNFNPNASITREDAVVILYRISQSLSLPLDGAKQFNDSHSVSDYAKKAVEAMAQNNLILGNEMNLFNPKANLTRAEAAVLFYRIVNLIG